ncbi:MAG: hypothetical protein U0V74_09345 [Chitinophagales bacterium]
MKKLLILPLLLLALISQAYNKYELLLGLRTGGGGSFLRYNEVNSNFGSFSGNATQISNGIAIPAKGEFLFGVKGFRMGYQFSYTHGIYKNYKRDYDNNPPGVDDYVDSAQNCRRNLFAHLFLMEYSIPIAAKGKCLVATTPFFGIGSFTGTKVDLDEDGQSVEKTYYKKLLKKGSKLALTAGIGFEFTVRRFCFMLAPTYTFYRLKPNDYSEDHGGIHQVTLDLAFRLNLLRPRY